MTAVVGHRGAARAERENTAEAFAAAIADGADWIELDVRKTADDVLVVHHDAQLDDGRVIAGMASTGVPGWLPTLAEALEACSGAAVNIEIKNSPGEPGYDAQHQISAAVAGLALAYRPADELLVSSFNIESVNRIRAIEPSLPTAVLVATQLMDLDLWLERLNALGHAGFNPHVSLVDRRLVDRSHDAGLAVHVWTVNDAEQMRRLVDLGVDSIITDHPHLARQIVDEAGPAG